MNDPVSLVVKPVVEQVLRSATSLIKKEVGLVLDVKKDVKKLASNLTSIQAVLQDAEEKKLENAQLRDWIGKLKIAAYDAQDILETLATDVALRKGKQPSKMSYQFDAAHKIKKLSSRLEIIAGEKKKFGLQNMDVTNGRPSISDHPLTGSVVNTADIFGRDAEKESIIKLLLSNEFDAEGDVSVIPIIGMAGVGKTTLAQLLFHEERIKKHFESRMWVCVTVDFDLRRILKEMIQFHSKMKYGENLSVGLLESRLLEFLSGKRFLLVLDDVWTENYMEWEPLQKLLKRGNKGSRVLVTSRTIQVSKMMGAQSPYLLQYLPDDECWSIFKKIALNQGNLSSGMRQQLEDIGRNIVGKCKGLPLAVKAMAGFLRNYDDVNKWQKILSSNIWELEDETSRTHRPNILPVLKLSYDHLPCYLKHCFSYCALFPKAYIFDKVELVKHWAAQSLIQSRAQEREEDIGMEHFDELFARSFFQLSNIDNKERYHMHDLIHDLAQLISNTHCCQEMDDKPCSSSPETRHVSLFCKDVEQSALSVVKNSEKLRTLVFPAEHLKEFGRAGTLDRIFHKLKYLRLLDLSTSTILELPDSIEELKLLRYLDLSKTEIKVLPNSICNLYNLQTLKLMGCIWFMELPKNLANLVNLRNLELDDMYWFKSSTLPSRIGKLTNLYNLHTFRVGCKSGYGIEELKELAYLTGPLHISKLENAVNGREAKMDDKRRLQKLVLEWSDRNVGPRNVSDEEKLLEDLQPHLNLKELQIFNYLGISVPRWMRDGRLQNLVSLTFKGCTKCRILSLGQLPHLHELCIKGLLELEKWPNDVQYTNLFTLKISKCPKLNECPGTFPKLQVMKVKKCLSLKALPVTPYLRSLILIDNLNLENWNEADVERILVNDDGQPEARIPLSSFIYLLELKVINCPKLQSLPKIFVPEKLEISGCEVLSTLPNSHFSQCLQLLALDACPDGTLVRAIPETSSLNYIIVSNVSNLDSFPRWPNLPGLRALYISHCKDLVSISGEGTLQNLTSLSLLSVRDCSKLENFPDEGLPTSLECLIIASCSILKSLGTKGALKSLNSLKDLYIEDCPVLQSFPEDGVPENLQHLVIKNCPPLTEKCQNEHGQGPEWLKIKDIPDLEIDLTKSTTTIMPKTKPSSTITWYCPFVCGGGLKGKEKVEPGESSASAGCSKCTQ